MDHEEAILRGLKDGSTLLLERALLVLSGLVTNEEIRSYSAKIDNIYRLFLSKACIAGFTEESKPKPYLHRTVSKCLFDYLWVSQPKRYGESFLLTEVADAQLSPGVSPSIGTCVGLTSLYSVLGLRAGLNLSLMVNSDHLLSRLRIGHEAIDIDHTDPQGFDCHTGEGFQEFPLLTLAANVLNSRGLANEKSGRFAAAEADYRKALLVSSSYANAWNNRGNMRYRNGDFEGAISDYTEAIRLNPSFSEAYCNRGMARQRLGSCVEAEQDYQKAISINPEYHDALICLQSLEGIEGRELGLS